jgi:hypothetical protein
MKTHEILLFILYLLSIFIALLFGYRLNQIESKIDNLKPIQLHLDSKTEYPVGK